MAATYVIRTSVRRKLKNLSLTHTTGSFLEARWYSAKVELRTPTRYGSRRFRHHQAVGSDVTSVKVGDSVAIEPGTPCRRCKACKAGFYNLCIDMRFAAAPPDAHGLLTQYYLAPEDFVYKISGGAGLQEAVLIEPLAVAVHANRQVDVRPGQDVVIFGSGTIGLLCAAVARTFGAQQHHSSGRCRSQVEICQRVSWM